MNLKNYFILILCTLLILNYSKVMANEEAKYEVIDKNEIYEIRKYSDRLGLKPLELELIVILENYLITYQAEMMLKRK